MATKLSDEELEKLLERFGERRIISAQRTEKIRQTVPALAERARETLLNPPEVTGEMAARIGLPAVGGAGGAAVGGFPGMVIGAMGGAAAAEVMFGEATEDSLRKVMREEGLITAGTFGLVRGGRAMIRGVAGATGKRRKLAQDAFDQFGVRLGAADVGTAVIPGFFSRVLARFPFMGGGTMRRQIQRKFKEVVVGADRLFARIGPSIGMAKAGINLNIAATRRFKAFRDVVNARYGRIKDAMREQKATLSTEPIEDELLLAREAIKRSRTPGIKGPISPAEEFINRWLTKKVVSVAKPTGVRRAAGLPPERQAVRVRAMPERFDIDQLDGPNGFLKDLDETMTLARGKGSDLRALMDIKEAAERALVETLDNPQLAADLVATDEFFTRMMRTTFETPTAKRFQAVIKGRFQMGLKRQGTLTAEELSEVIFKGPGAKAGATFSSAERVKEIRRLVGPENMRNAVRAHLDEAFEQARSSARAVIDRSGNKVFDTDMLRKRFGLDNPKSNTFQAIDEALKGTGSSAKQLSDFMDVIDLAFKNAPANVNDFIARRATLGGIKALTRAFTPAMVAGAKGGAGITTTLGLLLIVRKFAAVVSDPKTMSMARQALRNDIAPGVKTAAIIRLANELTKDEGGLRAVGQVPGDDPEVVEIQKELLELFQ